MKKTVVVGIAGGSASGKSTICDRLEKAFQGQSMRVFHMDDYFKEEARRPVAKGLVSGKVYVDDNHPETMDLPQMAEDLRKAMAEEPTLILAEGLLTLSDDVIYSLLDLRLFVDCRADERIIRRIRRNMEWGLSMEEITNVYLDVVRYRHDEYVENAKWRADFILNGSNFTETAERELVQMITRLIQE